MLSSGFAICRGYLLILKKQSCSIPRSPLHFQDILLPLVAVVPLSASFQSYLKKVFS